MNRNARILGLFLLAVMLLPLAGCFLKPNPKPVVPDYPTAREQARVALKAYEDAKRTIDKDLKKKEYRNAEAALLKVTERFPKDRVYTPASHVTLGVSYFDRENYDAAEATLRAVLKKYPDIPDVHATTLYFLGRTLNEQKRYVESKNYLRQLIETYRETNDPKIQEMVRQAKPIYDRIES